MYRLPIDRWTKGVAYLANIFNFISFVDRINKSYDRGWCRILYRGFGLNWNLGMDCGFCWEKMVLATSICSQRSKFATRVVKIGVCNKLKKKCHMDQYERFYFMVKIARNVNIAKIYWNAKSSIKLLDLSYFQQVSYNLLVEFSASRKYFLWLFNQKWNGFYEILNYFTVFQNFDDFLAFKPLLWCVETIERFLQHFDEFYESLSDFRSA